MNEKATCVQPLVFWSLANKLSQKPQTVRGSQVCQALWPSLENTSYHFGFEFCAHLSSTYNLGLFFVFVVVLFLFLNFMIFYFIAKETDFSPLEKNGLGILLHLKLLIPIS